MPSDSQLTAKQEAFALALVRPGMTRTAAYREAYNTKNMTSASVWQNASHLAADVKVAPRIAELREQAAQLAVVSGAQVLERLAMVAFSDIGGVLGWDAKGTLTLTPSADLDPDTRAAIKSITKRADGSVTVEMRDPVTAAVAIGRHLGMFPTRVEQTGKDGGPIDVRVLVGYLDRLDLSDAQLQRLATLTEPQDEKEAT